MRVIPPYLLTLTHNPLLTDLSFRSIIAVHGLDLSHNEEHGIATWTENGITWLKDFLPQQPRMKRLRVLVFGYNSRAVFGASTTGVYGAAENLINQLSLIRKECPERPIVFVCHSLGGIVVKRAIVSAHTTDYYRSIYDSTKGVAFFATPHNGGNGVTFGDVLVKICRAVTGNVRNDIVEALRKDSNIAGHINRDFTHRAQGLRVLNFVETKRVLKPFKGIVVDQSSASLNWKEPAEIQILMEATHRTICKYGKEDELYERVSKNMADLISWAVESSSQNLITTLPILTFSAPDVDQDQAPPRYEERDMADDSLTRQSSPLPTAMAKSATKVHIFFQHLPLIQKLLVISVKTLSKEKAAFLALQSSRGQCTCSPTSHRSRQDSSRGMICLTL